MLAVALLAITATPVAVDWSQVPDAVIERCELAGLETVLLQELIEAGYAVVADSGARGISLEIRVRGAGFDIVTRRGAEVRSERVHIPEPCDSTIGFSLANAATAALASFEVIEPPAPPPPGADWAFQASAGGVFPGSTFALAAVRVGVVRRLPASLGAGLVFEGSVRSADGLVVSEPMLAVQLLWRAIEDGPLRVSAGLELGVIGHVFSREGDSGGHVDGRFGVPITLALEAVPIALFIVPHTRLVPVLHRSSGDITYEAEHLGLVASIGVHLD